MIKVMVVDDDKLVRKGLISAMPWQEFDMTVVGEASNGEKALELLEAQSVDLLLTDLAMPVMSGIELIRHVRQRFPHIYIVVLTLHQDFEYIQEVLRLGAIDYIAKVQLEQERFEEVLARIHTRIAQESTKGAVLIESKERDHFYDNESDSGINAALRAAESDRKGRDEERQKQVREKWSAYEWIYQDKLFDNHLHDLKELRLAQSKLIGLLFSLVDRWNLFLYPISSVKIQLEDSFDSWHEVEAWLMNTRLLIRNAIDKPSYSHEVIECIIKAAYIAHEEMNQQITAAGIAKRINMSRSYFSQCFKEITGINFSEHLRRIRLEKAKEYLLVTNKTIFWIAESVGYLDEKYFSRTFREHTGMLPSEYRQTNGAVRNMSDK